MGYSHDLCTQVASTFPNRSGHSQRRAGDFKRNLRCWPKRAVHSNQGTASGDIHRSGKLKEILATLVPAADENRDGERQTGPLAALNVRFPAVQAYVPFFNAKIVLLAHNGPKYPNPGPQFHALKSDRTGTLRSLCRNRQTNSDFAMKIQAFVGLTLERIYRM